MVSPSVKAKPRTLPTESTYSTTAAISEMKSAAMMVRLARDPARLEGRPQRPAVAHFVTDAFEVDDERVGGDADRDDQTGDARQGQREVRASRPG